jgi:hypothetical protein
VGVTDLEIVFVVIATNTSAPIDGAKVDVVDNGRITSGRSAEEFQLLTDRDGMATRLCPRCRWAGYRSGLRITDTFAVRPPNWSVRVSADGYESSELQDLCESENVTKSRRVAPQAARLFVHVALPNADH